MLWWGVGLNSGKQADLQDEHSLEAVFTGVPPRWGTLGHLGLRHTATAKAPFLRLGEEEAIPSKVHGPSPWWRPFKEAKGTGKPRSQPKVSPVPDGLGWAGVDTRLPM